MLLHHGSTIYLLGLEWVEVDGGSPIQHLREIVGRDGHAFYQVVGSRREGQLIGFTRELPDLGDKKKAPKAYSLAAVVAARGEDGIYFLEMGTQAWYAVIQGGQLMRTGGEMLMLLDHAIDAVKQLSETLELQVYASSPHFPHAQPFALTDLHRIRHKPAPMRPLKGSKEGPLSILVFVCVLVGLGYVGWLLLLRSPTPAASAAELEQQARDQYVQTMLGTLPVLSADADWAVGALSEAGSTFPAVVSGWQRQGLICSPLQCQATYGISPNHTAFSYHDLRGRFGEARVQLKDNLREATVVMERAADLVQWTPDWILNPEPARAHLVDVHGLIRLRVPQVNVDQTMHREGISQGLQPPSIGGITRELIVTSGTEAYPAPVVGRLADALGPAGFVPDHIEIAYGAQGREATWRAQWVRFAGDTR